MEWSGGKVVHDVNLLITISYETQNQDVAINMENLQVYSALASNQDLPSKFLPRSQIVTNQGAACFVLMLHGNLVLSLIRLRINVRWQQRVLTVCTGWFNIYRYKLEVLKQPDSVFFKDQSGEKNKLTTVIGFKDMLQDKCLTNNSITRVPILVKLAYEDGAETPFPTKQSILSIKSFENHVVGINQPVTIVFRINDVSKNHFNGRRFRLMIYSDPSVSNICHCFTNPIQVFSKQKKNLPSTPRLSDIRLFGRFPKPKDDDLTSSISDYSKKEELATLQWAREAASVLKKLEYVEVGTEFNSEGLKVLLYGCAMCHQQMNPFRYKVQHLDSCELGQSLSMYKGPTDMLCLDKNLGQSFFPESEYALQMTSNSTVVNDHARIPQLQKPDVEPRVSSSLLFSTDMEIDNIMEDVNVLYILATDLYRNDPTKFGIISIWPAYDLRESFCGFYMHRFDQPSQIHFKPAVQTPHRKDAESVFLDHKLKEALSNNELVLLKFCYDTKEALLAHLLANLF